ncbi:MAG: TIM barrel protein [Verrucomicrobiota bacterium]
MKRPLAISTCWNSGRHSDGLAMMEELASLGFDQVELGHGIRFSLWDGMMKAREKGVAQIVSLHNFCPLPTGFTRANPNCYEFSDHRAHIRKRAVKCTKETIQYADELDARRVVLHLGSTGQPQASPELEQALADGKFGSKSFVKKKLKAITEHEELYKRTWGRVQPVLDELVPFAQQRKVRLGCECREEIEEFPIESGFAEILARYPGDVLGYWHDFGHAARKSALGFIDHETHFKKYADRLIGVHVHDFKYPNRDHRPLGTGLIPFQRMWPYLPQGLIPTLELSPRLSKEEVKSCLMWWKKNGPEQ